MAQKNCLPADELSAAIAGTDEAVAVDQQVVDLEGQTPAVLLQAAKSRVKLAESYREAGDLATAARHLDQAAEYSEQLLAGGEPTTDVLGTVSWCWFNLGRVHLEQADPEAASKHLDKAFALGQELLERQEKTPRVLLEVTKTYSELGDFYRDTGDPATAAVYYQKGGEYGHQSRGKVDGGRHRRDRRHDQPGHLQGTHAAAVPRGAGVVAAVPHTDDLEPPGRHHSGSSVADDTAPRPADATAFSRPRAEGVGVGYAGSGGSAGHGGASPPGASPPYLPPTGSQPVEGPPTRRRLPLLPLVLLSLVLAAAAVFFFFLLRDDDDNRLLETQPTRTLPAAAPDNDSGGTDTPGSITPHVPPAFETTRTASRVTSPTPAVRTTGGTGTPGSSPPKGGVNTGGGGTAVQDDAGLVPVVGAIALFALLGASWATWRARIEPAI